MLSESIAKLVQYGVETELIPECERNYTTNLLLDVFYEDDYTAPEQEFQNIELEKVLDELLKEAIDRGLIEDSVVYKDLFDVFYEDDYTAPEQEFQNIEQLVGGSILSHDHFQGGHYTFAMAKAPIEKHVTIPGFEDVEAGIVKWPLSVLRIRHKNPERLIDLATHVLQAWRGYTDEAAFVFANTDGEPHNTITPIARKVEDVYELDLTLRNNITTKEHPLGVYHPHAQYHHIKKENIGLIEVMGLAVLPARLKEELELLEEYILSGKDISSNEKIAKHEDWVKELLEKYPDINAENIQAILQKEVGLVFVHVLEDAGVYKCTPKGREDFMRFVDSL